MAGDWIKIHRKLAESAAARDPVVLKTWIFLLIDANFADRQLDSGVVIKRGELVISQESYARLRLNVSRQQLRTALNKLVKCGNLTIESTKAGTHITIKNYGTYQDSESPINQDSNQRATNEQPTANQQPTNEQPENKKDKKERKEECKENTPPPPKDEWIIPRHLDSPEVRRELENFRIMRQRIRKPIKSLQNTSRVLKRFDSQQHLLRAIDHVIANEYQGLDPIYGRGLFNGKPTEKTTNVQRATTGTPVDAA